MALEQELATYRARLHEFREHEGKYVLISRDEVVEFFSTYEDAIKVGYARFGLNPFLVKKVQTLEQVHSVTRFVAPREAQL